MVHQSEVIERSHLGFLAQKLQTDTEGVSAIPSVESIGVEADAPVEAADGEGGGPDEAARAETLVQAEPVDLERVRGVRRLRRAPRRRPHPRTLRCRRRRHFCCLLAEEPRAVEEVVRGRRRGAARRGVESRSGCGCGGRGRGASKGTAAWWGIDSL